MATRKPSPPVPLKRPATLDHLRKKEPREGTLAVVISDSAAEHYEECRRAAFHATGDDLVAAHEALKAAEDELAEATVHITVRAIGRRAYENLARSHPPTEAQIAEVKKAAPDATPQWNTDTFPPALVAACMIEPTISIAEATELLDNWNIEESTRLFMACETVCQQGRSADLGKGYGRTRS